MDSCIPKEEEEEGGLECLCPAGIQPIKPYQKQKHVYTQLVIDTINKKIFR
jgi:hypothetical protein